MVMREKPLRQFKICLIGDGYVGKTSIRRKYLRAGFKRSYIPTLGVDFAQKTVLFEGTKTNLIIWDIAGQSLFQNLRRRYYDGCGGMILVYSVVDRTAFDNASKWLVEAHRFLRKLPPLIIVGNKIDLRPGYTQGETVSTEEGQEFTEKISEELKTRAVFIETSALTGENIDEGFETLTKMMIDKAEKRAPVVEAKKPEIAMSAATTTSSEPGPIEATPEVSSAVPTVSSSSDSSVVSNDVAPQGVEIDPVTSLPVDSVLLEEEEIGTHMTKLVDLRAQLKRKEDELANETSKLETRLLTLRNTVHVKKIMFDHLQQQLQITKQEWKEAYDEYQEIDKRKKAMLARGSADIEDIRERIEKVGKTIRSRINHLDMKKMTE
jgi:small GTP-binding protein